MVAVDTAETCLSNRKDLYLIGSTVRVIGITFARGANGLLDRLQVRIRDRRTLECWNWLLRNSCHKEITFARGAHGLLDRLQVNGGTIEAALCELSTPALPPVGLRNTSKLLVTGGPALWVRASLPLRDCERGTAWRGR